MRTSSDAGSQAGGHPGAQAKAGPRNSKCSHGKILVVGLGPGAGDLMTVRALEALQGADLIIGYKRYIELLAEFIGDKPVISSGMRHEVERAQMAVREARSGKLVVVVSSGDAGIYGMGGLVMELAAGSVPVELIPGVTAATAAAAKVGAPLMHDFAVISLSDLLTPIDTIMARLEAAGWGDYVIILYNPASSTRTEPIRRAREILLQYRDPLTPVAIVRNAEREGEVVQLTTLQDMLTVKIDMLCTVIIGNSQSRIEHGQMITPRGYQL